MRMGRNNHVRTELVTIRPTALTRRQTVRPDMDATETTTADDESVPANDHADRPVGDPAETSPRDHAETVPGGSAYVEASTALADVDVRIFGSRDIDEGPPTVNLGLETQEKVKEVGLSIGLSPDQAREVAAELERQADFAEAYVEHRRQQERDGAE